MSRLSRLPRGTLIALVVIAGMLLSSAMLGQSASGRSVTPVRTPARVASSRLTAPLGSSRTASALPTDLPLVDSTLSLWNDTFVSGNYLNPAPYGLAANEGTALGWGIGYDPIHNTLYVSGFSESGAVSHSCVFNGTVYYSTAGIYRFNGTTGAGENWLCIPGTSPPSQFLYDSVNREMYFVGEEMAGAINTTTGSLTSIAVPYVTVGAITYVPVLNRLYAVYRTLSGTSGGILVIDPVSNRVVANLPILTLGEIGPDQITYDAADGEVYVSEATSSAFSCGGLCGWNLTAINVTNNTPVAEIPGEWANAVAYVPGAQEIYALRTPSGGGTSSLMSIVNSSNQIVANYSGFSPVGSGFPITMALDPANQYLFVANDLYGDIVAIDTANDTGIWSASPSRVATNDGPCGIAFASDSNDLFASGGSTLYSFGGLYRINASTGNTTIITVGISPTSIVYVPSVQEFYAANEQGYGFLVVLNSSGRLVANVSIGSGIPFSLAYDPTNGTVYVASEPIPNYAGQWLAAVNTSTRAVTIVATESQTLCTPEGMALATNIDRIYVTCASGSVAVVNTSTNHIVTLVSNNGTGAAAMAYDPVDRALFVVNRGSDNVTVLNTTSDRFVASIPVGLAPFSAFYDPDNGLIYVANSYGNLTVIDPANMTSIASIPGFQFVFASPYSPDVFGLDSVHHRMYVATSETSYSFFDGCAGECLAGNLTVLNSTTGSILGWTTTPVDPAGIAYDPTTGELLVSSYSDGSISVLGPASSSPTGTISAPLTSAGIGQGPVGTVLSFSAAGLSPDTPYELTLDATPGSPSALVSDFTTDPTGGFSGRFTAQAESPCCGTFYLLGAGTYHAEVWEYGNLVSEVSSPPAGEFVVTLPTLTVSPLTGAAGTTVTISGTEYAPGYTYAYCFENSTATPCPTGSPRFTTNATGAIPVGTTIPVPLGNNSQAVVSDGLTPFVDATHYFLPLPSYPVTFTESGAASGTSWTVTLGGTVRTATSPSITFEEGNGTYAFTVGPVAGYTVAPPSGRLNVAGAPVRQAVTLTPVPTYAVTFTETGLPSGTSWTVTLNGSAQTSTASTAIFSMANGSYAFTIGAVAGFTASPNSGSLAVAGGPVGQSVAFTAVPPAEYPVTFTETGIASGTSWELEVTQTSPVAVAGPVALAAASWFTNSTSSTAVLQLPNGTYSWTVSAIGYQTDSGTGLTVHGQQAAQAVVLNAVSSTHNPAPPPASLAGIPWLYVIVGLVAAVLVVGVLVLALRRPGGGGGTPPPT